MVHLEKATTEPLAQMGYLVQVAYGRLLCHSWIGIFFYQY